MADPRASDFTDASTAMLEAATGAARGFLMSIGIVLDDGTCAALACVVTQAAILAQVESDKEMPEPVPASTRGHIFGSHQLDFNTGKCPCGVTQIELEDALASKDCPLAKA